MRFGGCVGITFVLLVGCSQAGDHAAPDPQAQSASSSSGAAGPAIPEVVPGVSIGPVRIGMTRSEIGALGFPVKPGELQSDVSVGPYVATMEGDRVDAVRVELRSLPSGIKVGGAVHVAGTATITTIAAKLAKCGSLQVMEGGNVIACDGGRTQVSAGGPVGIIAIQVLSAARAARFSAATTAPTATAAPTVTAAPTATAGSTVTAAPKATAAPTATAASTAGASQGAAAPEATWTHPSMNMSFTYPQKLLKVRHKPDGATLESEILGTIEDRSGQGKDKPTPLTITISVRAGKLLAVMKSNPALQLPMIFPAGTEASFKEEKGFAERLTVAGNAGYRIHTGSHDVQKELVYAPLPPSSTLEVLCNYVGDMAKPKVPMATQKKACDRVLATLSIKL